ncbi:MAG: hypothetical protein QW597_00255 [Thermoplasmataceae archaeon]
MQPEEPNPDIPQEVKENRGLLKKIQLIIPGFREYRIGDDLRAADALLRKQISSSLNRSIAALQSARSRLASDGDFNNLTSIASALSKLQQLDGEILHSAQGYTGISPTIRIDASRLNSLYKYDLGFLDYSEKFETLSGSLPLNDSNALKQRMDDISGLAVEVKNNWEKRIETIENILISRGGDKQ